MKHRMEKWVGMALAVAITVSLCGCALIPSLKKKTSSASQAFSGVQQATGISAPQSASDEPVDMPIKALEKPKAAGSGINPLTGRPAPEGMAEGQRPVAVMVRNSYRALPQRGVCKANVLVEMPVEDGTTNVMALFADMRDIPDTGPVCALQDQFLQMALPVQAIPIHIGASQYARNLMGVTGYKSLDGIYAGTSAFWYDYQRTLPRPGGHLHEYSWYSRSDMMMAAMDAYSIEKAGEVPLLFQFVGESEWPKPSTDVMRIEVRYSGLSELAFWYNDRDDKEKYYDTVQGEDRRGDDDGRTSYENVVILQTKVEPKEDSTLLEVDFSGGKGWYFNRGHVTEIKWQKGGPSAMLQLYDKDNNPLAVSQGNSYIGFVPKNDESKVEWFSEKQLKDKE